MTIGVMGVRKPPTSTVASAVFSGRLSAHPLKWLKSKVKPVADGRADRVLVALPLRMAKTKALGATEKGKDEWDCFRIVRLLGATQSCFLIVS